MKDVTVTFIASPDSSGDYTRDPYKGLPDPKNGVAPAGFIEDVYATLLTQGVRHVSVGTRSEIEKQAGQSPATRLLVRVKSVEQIAGWLSNYFYDDLPHQEVPKLRLQIIGHSTSGALHLAGSWLDNPDPETTPHVSLTSSPAALASLMQIRHAVVEVRLAGCYVGAWQTNGCPTNGRTLTFALAELFACRVRGAAAEVTRSKFDKGWLQPPVIGWSWHESSMALDPQHKTTLQCDVTKPFPVPTKASVTSGTRQVVKRSLLDDERVHLGKYFSGEVDPEDAPKLAVGELGLELEYETEKKKAMLLCGGLFLAVEDADGWKYYSNPNLETDKAISKIISSVNYPPPRTTNIAGK